MYPHRKYVQCTHVQTCNLQRKMFGFFPSLPCYRTPDTPVLATWESSEHKEFDISRVGQHLLEQSHSNNSFQFEALNRHDLKQQNKPIHHSLFPRPADLIVLCTWSHVQVSCFIFIQKAHLKTTISGLQLPSVVNPTVVTCYKTPGLAKFWFVVMTVPFLQSLLHLRGFAREPPSGITPTYTLTERET